MLHLRRFALALSIARGAHARRATASARATAVRDLLAQPPPAAPVTASGWLRSVRAQKTMCFAELHDGSTAEPLQLVWPAAQAAASAGVLSAFSR